MQLYIVGSNCFGLKIFDIYAILRNDFDEVPDELVLVCNVVIETPHHVILVRALLLICKLETHKEKEISPEPGDKLQRG